MNLKRKHSPKEAEHKDFGQAMKSAVYMKNIIR